jgi:hypothetical protein
VLNSEPREGKQDDEVVMIGFVPCKLQSKIYVGNQRVTKAGPTQMGRAIAEPDGDPGAHEELVIKRAKVVSKKGQEIVRPRFSTCRYLGEKGRTEQDRSGLSLNGFNKPGDRRESNPRGRYAQNTGRGVGLRLNPRQRRDRGVDGAGVHMRPAPRWFPAGLTKTQRRRLQKMRRAELAEKKEEEEHDKWFNQARPMRQTWREKRLAREKGIDSEDSRDNCDLKEDNAIESGDEGRTNTEALNVNMVFVIPAEFRAPEASDVAELTIGAQR